MLKPTRKVTQSPWLIGLVGALLLLSEVFWKPRPEVVQAIHSYCNGLPVRLSQRASGGPGDGNWWERSVYICLPDYLRNAESYEIEGASGRAIKVTESKNLWPYLFVLFAVGWGGHVLWTVRNRQPNGKSR